MTFTTKFLDFFNPLPFVCIQQIIYSVNACYLPYNVCISTSPSPLPV